MDTTKLFLQLTSETYPHGTESQLEKYLPKDINIDNYGNYYIEVGKDYTTMFTSHLDTACGSINTGRKQKIYHKISSDGKTVSTKGNTILGGDCKSGVVIMLNMIENRVPGLYYFFLGEEVGCKGSSWLSIQMKKGTMFPNNKISKVISFDRRGTRSIITYQWEGRCASDKFADGLISEFGKNGMIMEKDTTGVCTDSIQFQDFIPECTNISTGYYSEHTSNESQDLDFLKRISEVVTKIDWESLPIDRDPSVSDYDNYFNMRGGYDFDIDFEEEEYKTWDEDYTCTLSSPYGGKVDVYISVERVWYEKKIIRDILIDWGFPSTLEAEEVEWDGNHLKLSWDGDNMDVLTRRDLTFSDNRLSNIKSEDIMLMSDVKKNGFPRTRMIQSKEKW